MKIAISRAHAAFAILAALAISGCHHAPIVQQNEAVSVPEQAGAKIVYDLEIHRLSVGEYDTGQTALYPPREYCETDPAAHAIKTCGPRLQQMWLVARQAGNKCGYGYYIFVCKKP